MVLHHKKEGENLVGSIGTCRSPRPATFLNSIPWTRRSPATDPFRYVLYAGNPGDLCVQAYYETPPILFGLGLRKGWCTPPRLHLRPPFPLFPRISFLFSIGEPLKRKTTPHSTAQIPRCNIPLYALMLLRLLHLSVSPCLPLPVKWTLDFLPH